MDLSRWFQDQLRGGLDGFAWALQQLPQQRHSATPPPALGEWPARRHLFHLLFYEQQIALPALRWWLDGPAPGLPTSVEDAAWERAAELGMV